MRLLIKNGTIVDGTGKPGYAGGILVDGKRIAAMGDIEPDHCGPIIDARGMVVAPGFIDTYSHSDLKVLRSPYIEPKIRQGVTTKFLRQDGISPAQESGRT